MSLLCARSSRIGLRTDDSVDDAACRLRLFWNRQFGGEHLRDTHCSRELVSMRLAVDRFHRKGHTHRMCATLTNADCICNGNRDIFENVNTSIAEQCFSYISKFKFTLRGLAYPNSSVYLLLLLHLWNLKRTNIRPDNFGLATCHFPNSIMAMFLTKCVYETLQADASVEAGETDQWMTGNINDGIDEREDAYVEVRDEHADDTS